MALQTKIKGNLGQLSKKIENKFAKLSSGAELEKIAQTLNGAIQIRTQKQGRGISGQKMRKYSPQYAAFKSSTGRNTSFRDLTFTGNMWKSLTTSRGINSATMFFGSAQETNKAAGNNARTPFFGIGENEKKILREELNKLIKF